MKIPYHRKHHVVWFKEEGLFRKWFDRLAPLFFAAIFCLLPSYERWRDVPDSREGMLAAWLLFVTVFGLLLFFRLVASLWTCGRRISDLERRMEKLDGEDLDDRDPAHGGPLTPEEKKRLDDEHETARKAWETLNR